MGSMNLIEVFLAHVNLNGCMSKLLTACRGNFRTLEFLCARKYRINKSG